MVKERKVLGLLENNKLYILNDTYDKLIYCYKKIYGFEEWHRNPALVEAKIKEHLKKDKRLTGAIVSVGVTCKITNKQYTLKIKID